MSACSAAGSLLISCGWFTIAAAALSARSPTDCGLSALTFRNASRPPCTPCARSPSCDQAFAEWDAEAAEFEALGEADAAPTPIETMPPAARMAAAPTPRRVFIDGIDDFI